MSSDATNIPDAAVEAHLRASSEHARQYPVVEQLENAARIDREATRAGLAAALPHLIGEAPADRWSAAEQAALNAWTRGAGDPDSTAPMMDAVRAALRVVGGTNAAVTPADVLRLVEDYGTYCTLGQLGKAETLLDQIRDALRAAPSGETTAPAEVVDEYGVRYRWRDGTVEDHERPGRRWAEETVAHLTDTSVAVTVSLIRRQRITTPWVEVGTDAQATPTDLQRFIAQYGDARADIAVCDVAGDTTQAEQYRTKASALLDLIRIELDRLAAPSGETTAPRPAPNGCAHCGVEQRSHGQRYHDGESYGPWQEPTPEQRKARMLARRAAAKPDPCGHTIEGIGGRVLICTRPTGHDWAHADAWGAQWTEVGTDAQPAPTQEELSAEAWRAAGRRVRAELDAQATPTAPIVVHKLGYPVQVNVVDGIPQCPCHQEPMVKRGDEWMHPSDATAVELMALGAARIDEWLHAQPPAGDDQEENRHA